MSRAMITESNLTSIANAIRAKLGVETTYTPAQMAAAIGTIHGEPVNQEKTATQNGEVTPDSGYDGLSKVTVNVPEATLVSKSIVANGSYNPASDNADGYSGVTVNVPNSYAAADEGKVVSSGALVAQTAHADVTPTTSDQTIDTTNNNSIKVKGDANLQAGNIKKDVQIFGVTGSYEGGGGGATLITKNITQNGTYNASSDNADGYSQVTVNVSGSIAPDLTYLPNSTAASVDISQDYNSYESGKMAWGKVAFTTKTYNTSSVAPTKQADYIDVPYNTVGFSSVADVNTDMTVYLCVKLIAQSDTAGILSVSYAMSTKNQPNFWSTGQLVKGGTYNNDFQTNISATADYRVLVLKIDNTSKITTFFVDGAVVAEKAFTNSGWIIAFAAGTTNLDYPCELNVKYYGVVNEAESDATVIANSQTIMQKLGLSA